MNLVSRELAELVKVWCSAVRQLGHLANSGISGLGHLGEFGSGEQEKLGQTSVYSDRCRVRGMRDIRGLGLNHRVNGGMLWEGKGN